MPIMMGKRPYKVWVDLSGYWSAFSRCVIPFLGVGVPSKDVAVSCEDGGVPFKNVGVSFNDKGVPFQGVECPFMV